MKLSRIIDPKFQESFRKLMAQQLPLKTAFKLKGILSKTQEELDRYEETRQNALKQFGKKNDDGSLFVDNNGQVKLEGDSLDAFLKELNELVTVDVEVGSVKLGELGNNVIISTEELIALDAVIELD